MTRSSQLRPARAGDCRSTLKFSDSALTSSSRLLRIEGVGDDPAGEPPAQVLGVVGRSPQLDDQGPLGELARRPPCRRVLGRAAVDDEPSAGRRRQHTGERGPPDVGEVRQPGQTAAHVEPVGGDAVAQPDGAPQGGDDHDPGPGPTTRCGVEVGQTEPFVQRAGVHRARGRGRRLAERHVCTDQVAEAGAHVEAPQRVGTGADLGQRVEHGGAGGRERRERQAVRLEWLAAGDRRLPLRRRQQDEHDLFLPAAVHARRRGSRATGFGRAARPAW